MSKAWRFPHFPPLLAGSGAIRLRTLVMIRWGAIAGQVAALLIVYVGLGFDLPILPAIALVAASAALNIGSVRYHRTARLGEREAALYLAYDLVQLTALLALTGGLTNPFAILMVAPVAVSASFLSQRTTVGLSLLALIAISVLALWYVPLSWDGQAQQMNPIYLLGLWVALVIAVIFIAAYVSRIAAEARRMSDALTATQLALAREHRLAALGGLAAAAAHELGSPLSTIAVIARELSRELPHGSHLAEDARLLLSESGRCRDILARIAERPEGDAGGPLHRLPLPALLEVVATPYLHEGIDFEVRIHAGGEVADSPPPEVIRSPELVHGLGNLLQNAVQFASTRVEALVSWEAEEVTVVISDDGPGFDPAVLEHLGEPYLSTRMRGPRVEGREHMGLGVFIAGTLLARTGARLEFGNQASGGAEVVIRWPRPILAGEVSE